MWDLDSVLGYIMNPISHYEKVTLLLWVAYNYVTQANIKVMAVLLPQPLNSWDYMCEPPCLAHIRISLVITSHPAHPIPPP